MYVPTVPPGCVKWPRMANHVWMSPVVRPGVCVRLIICQVAASADNFTLEATTDVAPPAN
jgi:hypothetical protein